MKKVTVKEFFTDKNSIFAILVIAILTGCKCDKCNSDIKLELLTYEEPVDMSELVEMSKQDGRDQEVRSKEIVAIAEGENESVKDKDSYAICLPEYKDSENDFLAQAENYYNMCLFVHNTWSIMEDWMRFSDNFDEKDNMDMIKDLRSIDSKVIQNEKIRHLAKEYIDSLARVISEGDDTKIDAGEVRIHFMNEINNSITPFYDNEEELNMLLDSVTKIYNGMANETFEKLEAIDEDERETPALKELNACANFDAQCALFLKYAYADSYIYSMEMVIAAGERLLLSGKYSPLLFRIWISWRSMYQRLYCGGSTWSEIPNHLYNTVRSKCYITCLKRIEVCPNDLLAMNCAAVLGGYENLQRFGWDFGNGAIFRY